MSIPFMGLRYSTHHQKVGLSNKVSLLFVCKYNNTNNLLNFTTLEGSQQLNKYITPKSIKHRRLKMISATNLMESKSERSHFSSPNVKTQFFSALLNNGGKGGFHKALSGLNSDCGQSCLQYCILNHQVKPPELFIFFFFLQPCNQVQVSVGVTG